MGKNLQRCQRMPCETERNSSRLHYADINVLPAHFNMSIALRVSRNAEPTFRRWFAGKYR